MPAPGLNGTVDLIETIEPESYVTIVLQDPAAKRAGRRRLYGGCRDQRPVGLDTAAQRSPDTRAVARRAGAWPEGGTDCRSRSRPAVRCRERGGSVMRDASMARMCVSRPNIRPRGKLEQGKAAMRSTLKMPKVGDAANEVVIMEMLVKVGDTSSRARTCSRVETDKAKLEVPAPFGGKVAEYWSRSARKCRPARRPWCSRREMPRVHRFPAAAFRPVSGRIRARRHVPALAGTHHHRGGRPYVLPADAWRRARCTSTAISRRTKWSTAATSSSAPSSIRLLLGMSVPDISGRAVANLGLSELRHLAPLFHGDTLYGETEVLSARPSPSRPGQGILTVRTDGFNQDGQRSARSPARCFCRCACRGGMMDATAGPLAGIRVIELATVVAGPGTGRYLADFGAEVIKVEAPGGDPTRRMGWTGPGETDAYFWKLVNRNKKAITLDLKTDRGQGRSVAAARRCRRADREHAAGQARGAGLFAGGAAGEQPAAWSSCASAASARTAPMRCTPASPPSPRR